MTPIFQSASGLHRDDRCPANRSLPQVETNNPDAERGHAGHRYLELVGGGMAAEQALAQIAEEHRQLCQDIQLDGLPLNHEEYRQEVAFAYDLETGAARELGAGLQRDYSSRTPSEIVGTADVVLRDLVEVWDYKFEAFESRCPPPAKNPQLLFLALAACRTRGVDSAIVGLIHIAPDGTHWTEHADLDAFDLDTFEWELKKIRKKVLDAAAVVERGLTPQVSQGPWCRYCPATPHCPAILGLLRAAAGLPEEVLALRSSGLPETAESLHAALRNGTPDQWRAAYERMRQHEAAVKIAKHALWLLAGEQPFEVGDGQVYGPVRSDRKVYEARKARAALLELHGPEVAEAACEFETSAAAIERALRPVYEARRKAAAERKAAGEKVERVTLKALTVAATALLEAAGAIELKSTVTVKEHRAGKEGEVLAPAPAAAFPAESEATAA
ncbi:MAG TPA: DUF2800 domain-containing protein [Thermoanaerobaculia bacterium]|nr:DUF2800 domain-containing protein [Thermoanaerobaculia bacterium]